MFIDKILDIPVYIGLSLFSGDFFLNSVKEPDLHEINEKKCQFHHFLKATKSQKVFFNLVTSSKK